MELTGEQLLPLSRDRVWEALLDPDTLRQAIPGCEGIEDEGNGQYAVTVLLSVGPVRARFKGRLQQENLLRPERYTLSFSGEGGMAGFAKGSAEVMLSDATLEGQAGTRLIYQANAQVGGRLAQIGSRLIDATAARMAMQFFERFVAAVITPSTQAASSVSSQLEAAVPGSAKCPPRHVTRPADGGWSAPVVIQMPAWAWSFTILVVAVAAGWIAIQ